MSSEEDNDASEVGAAMARLRAKSLTPERRQEIARDAANARWGTKKSQSRRKKPSKP